MQSKNTDNKRKKIKEREEKKQMKEPQSKVITLRNQQRRCSSISPKR
jgi:hypothetical protein